MSLAVFFFSLRILSSTPTAQQDSHGRHKKHYLQKHSRQQGRHLPSSNLETLARGMNVCREDGD
jgi:hypothetical protein